MGGLFSIGTAAVHNEPAINAVAMVASPFDTSQNPLVRPVQLAGRVTGGRLVGTAARVVGGLPGPVVSASFKLTALPTYINKPMTAWSRRDDRESLAHVEAVDVLMNNMVAYPGRASIQVWQQLVVRNELATGRVHGPTRVLDLADVRVPVMNIAGTSDVLVTVPMADHVGLLANAPQVRLQTAPGGYLGVRTGRSAAMTTWPLIEEFLDAHQPAAV
ncbi:MAG TPA: hypothetical protein VHX88_11325 [Solirubrobacteraceae bacterium]|jgi:polyhydroxyalkanoate synthase|nr:hypothetical protein [Solirubrobacteraceae bacterium]